MESERYRLAETPWVVAAVYHAAFGLFVMELTYDILRGGMLRLAGVQPSDIALLLIFGFLGCFDGGFQRKLLSPISMVFFFLLAGYSVMGVLFGNSMGWIRTDLRTLLWLPGGFGMFYLLPRTKRPHLHFFITCTICSVMMYLAAQQSLSVHFSKTRFQAGEARLYGLNLFSVGVIMLPFIGTYLLVFAKRSKIQWAAAWMFAAVFLYYIVYLSATRNLMLSFIAMLGAALPYYLRGQKNGIVQPGWQVSRVINVGIVAVCLIALAGIFSQSLVIKRFGSGDFMREDSARGRVEELIAAYNNFDKVALVSGSGLGTTFRPYATYEANFLHLGLFTFLFKFGILGFASILVFFYLLVPGMLVYTALDQRDDENNRRRTGILVALPLLMPWIVQASISNGFEPPNYLAAGMALALYLEISHHGFERLLKPCA